MNTDKKQITIASYIEGLIFDLDGTLLDTMPVHYRAWRKSFEKWNFEFSTELFHELAGIPTKKIVEIINEKFSLKLDPMEVEKDKENAYLGLLDEVNPIVPALEIVQKYYNKLLMSIGTGSRRRVAEKTIKAGGLDIYFPVVVTADDVSKHKPHPETFLKCAELMGLIPEKCHVFEDGIQGIEAARSAGMSVTDIREYI
jgi:beta-phosphoglucomutase family hydrolase